MITALDLEDAIRRANPPMFSGLTLAQTPAGRTVAVVCNDGSPYVWKRDLCYSGQPCRITQNGTVFVS